MTQKHIIFILPSKAALVNLHPKTVSIQLTADPSNGDIIPLVLPVPPEALLGWGLLNHFPPFHYFPEFSPLSKHTSATKYTFILGRYHRS